MSGEVVWKLTVIAGETRPDDGTAWVQGRTVGRVYRNAHGIWQWFWQGSVGEAGSAADKAGAKAEIEKRALSTVGS